MSPCFCENKHIFAHQHHFMYCFHILHGLIFSSLSDSYTLLIIFYFIYLFLRRPFAILLFILCVSLLYPVTICCGKAQFPDRDHLISPSSPHKAPLLATARRVSYQDLLYCSSMVLIFCLQKQLSVCL